MSKLKAKVYIGMPEMPFQSSFISMSTSKSNETTGFLKKTHPILSDCCEDAVSSIVPHIKNLNRIHFNLQIEPLFE